jgi:hypothetical protein
MSVKLGVIGLVLLTVAGVLLFGHAVPDQAKTPRKLVDAGVDLTDARAERRAVVSAPPSAPSAGTSAPTDPLATLISAKGYGCATVVSALPIVAADGIFAIRCRTTSGGEAGYRVDTRRAEVSPELV